MGSINYILCLEIGLNSDNQKLFVTRSGYTGEDGFEVSISNDKAEKFVAKSN
jgi:glycine cleavage system aminomethyltransferase T